MPLAAILSAMAPSSDRPGVLRAQIVFAAQTLIEYQARQAMQAGANQIFVMVEAVTPSLSRMVDQFAATGVQVHLIRDMPSLVRQLPRESDVLLVADGAVIDQAYVAQVGKAEGNALLVAQDDTGTAHLERVDAQHRWAGLARVSPRTLFNTLDLIGDWDVVLTLMRAVVQSVPQRVVVEPADIAEGRVALVERQDTADLIGRALVAVPVGGSAGAEHYLLQRPARMAATHLLRMQISAAHIGIGALAIAALGLLAIVPGWTILALLLMLIALAVDMVARQVAAMGQHGVNSALTALALPVMLSLGMVWLGARQGDWSSGLHLAILSLAAVMLMRRGRISGLPLWAWMTPGSALLLLLGGAIVGQFGAALALAALLGLLSLVAMLLRDSRQSG